MKTHELHHPRGHLNEAQVSLVIPSAALEMLADRLEPFLRNRLSVQGEAKVTEFLTVDEAAALLRCRRGRIYDLVSSRRLPRLKDGSRVLIRRADIDAYLECETRKTR